MDLKGQPGLEADILDATLGGMLGMDRPGGLRGVDAEIGLIVSIGDDRRAKPNIGAETRGEDFRDVVRDGQASDHAFMRAAYVLKDLRANLQISDLGLAVYP